MLNLLTDPLISVVDREGNTRQCSLPEIYGLMASDSVSSFPHLRAHQAPAWHALLVQLGFLACETADLTVPPKSPEHWLRLLRTLTPDWPHDEPWSLIAENDGIPTFLQAPQLPGSPPLKNRIDYPDQLDILVTSKNHDLKQALARAGTPEDWLFALVSLQTQEGFLGAGNYGCARMNGGFGSRSYLTIAPSGAGFGARVFRDLRRLLKDSADFYAIADFLGGRKGTALLWLLPWDGNTSLDLASLHPLFVEVCRRVRLYSADGAIHARAGGSKVPRIDSKASKGHVGDPWLPLDVSGEPKAFTLTAEGFSYRRLTRLLFDTSRYRRPWLLKTDPEESASALELDALGLVRGQGKTEGFHRRRVLIPGPAARQMWEPDKAAQLSLRSEAFIALAAAAQGKALRPALIQLFQGKESPDWTRPDNDALCEPWLIAFDRQVDSVFFQSFFALLDVDDDEANRLFSRQLADIARGVLRSAAEAAPRAECRRDIGIARASLLLSAALKKHLPALKEMETAA